jgi:hypothetical protein
MLSKNFTFASLCEWINKSENGTIEFKLKHCFHENKEEVYCIQKLDNHLIISDMGYTLKNLDSVFRLSEHAVRKNILAVLNYYNISAVYNSFIYRFDTERNIAHQIQIYLQGIHFLYTMKLFYE